MSAPITVTDAHRQLAERILDMTFGLRLGPANSLDNAALLIAESEAAKACPNVVSANGANYCMMAEGTVAALTARVEAAEERYLTAQHFKEETDKICDSWKARAEADEALVAEKDSALKRVLVIHDFHPADEKIIQDALALTPASTASVIAELRKEVTMLRIEGEPCSIYEASQKSTGAISRIHQYDAKACSDALTQKDAEIARLTEIGVAQRQINTDLSQENQQLERQHDALIAVISDGAMAERIACSLYGYFNGGSAGSADAVRYFQNNKRSGESAHLIERVQAELKAAVSGASSSPTPPAEPVLHIEGLTDGHTIYASAVTGGGA